MLHTNIYYKLLEANLILGYKLFDKEGVIGVLSVYKSVLERL